MITERQLLQPTHTPSGIPFWMASIAVPGWGQICQGRALGLLWLPAAVGGYWYAAWLGLLVHALCVIDAGVFAVRARASRADSV